jgi:hypothetical protein
VRSSSQPPSGSGAVLGLERAHVVDRQQVVRVRGGLGRLVDHDRRADEPRRRHAREVLTVLARDPVDRRVEVRADVLADLEPAPRPRRPAVVRSG